MIECGCCHMYMGEMEEALRLWNQIEQIIREAPESYYSKITLEMYRISCELLQGHEEEALKLAVRLMKELYGIDMEETQYGKTYDKIPTPDIAISMGCDVGCPYIGKDFDDNWGLPDPTGQSDEVFKEVIKQIERKIWTISYDLTKNED